MKKITAVILTISAIRAYYTGRVCTVYIKDREPLVTSGAPYEVNEKVVKAMYDTTKEQPLTQVEFDSITKTNIFMANLKLTALKVNVWVEDDVELNTGKG